MFFFSKNNIINFDPVSVESAYFALLHDDLKTAKKIFQSIDSPRAKWGGALIEILSGYVQLYPTYFEIRNFLEIDLDFFIKNEKIEYLEHILGSTEILIRINQETYKYVARVMFENKFYKAAREYLEKSKNIFYNDPELHFLYAKYYFKTKEYNKANFHIEECLNILPNYYPALNFQKEISRYLAW